ncbi:MAG: hypothetical protein JSU58_03200 [Dehalococcoidales bacterium]|nr:MAG: hypothetical protein JSU58_03200 [Dehalococcoidales bacterium]
MEIDLTEPDFLPYTETYNEGTVIQLEAIPSFGYTFNGWEKHFTSTENPAFIVMDCNKYITASFKVNWRQIGTAIGGLALVIFLVVILIIRRRNSAKETA